MPNKTATILAVGDMIVDGPDSESLFALAAPVLKSADIVVGQLEIPYTTRVYPPMQPRDPNILKVLSVANFNVLTFVGNHTADLGAPGIEDSITWIRDHNIALVGAGMNIF